jgi:ABC-type lipoprotein export system ATPase subunit
MAQPAATHRTKTIPFAPESKSANDFHRIQSIAFSGGFFDGTKIELADGLNCLIGNRGTGKTTALEFVRYALDSFPEDPKLRRRVEDLVAQNLGGGRVELVIETRDGMEYTVSRTADDPPIVYTPDGEPTSISLGAAGVFRADVFSQNEVESIAGDPASQLSLLDGFIAADVAELNRDEEEILNELRTNALKLAKVEEQRTSSQEQASELPAVEEALRKFKVTKDGSTDAIDDAHARKALRDRESRAIDDTLEYFRELHSELSALSGVVADHLAETFDDELLGGPNGEALRDAIDRVQPQVEAIDEAVSAAVSSVEAAGKAIKETQAKLKREHARQEAQFRKIIEKHKEAEKQSLERAALERKRNALNALKKTQAELGTDVAGMREERSRLLSQLSELRDRRFRLRRDKALEITDQLSPEIRVRLDQFGNRDSYREMLEQRLGGRNINRKVVARRVADTIAPAELAEIVLVRGEQELIDKAGVNPNQAIAVIEAFSDRQLQFELETVELTDQPTIDLRDGEVYKDSLSLSTGQKCTAILPILMLDSANPLLIDQPEDNLDNRFMVNAIVNSIRSVKASRQLVFVTHNPNIPVLGDADRVFVLDSDGRRARVSNVGTVDELKDEVVTLLEGGRDAFLERKERYGY